MKEETDTERLERQTKALRLIQLKAGDMLGQLTSNHPWYKEFEYIHRLAASAQANRGPTADEYFERAMKTARW